MYIKLHPEENKGIRRVVSFAALMCFKKKLYICRVL